MISLNKRILYAFALLTAGLCASIVAAAPDNLVPVPHPNLDTLTPDIRRSLAPALDQFEKKLDQASGTELGGVYGKLGLHYQAHEQQAAARACYENAMALDPEGFQWPYYLAVHFEETGDVPRAVENYRRSLGLNPGNEAGATRLGLLLVESGEVEGGESVLRGVLDANPENAAALAGLGAVSAAREQYAEAVNYYRKALSIQPEASQLHYRLGLAYRQLGDVEQAKKELEQRGPRIPHINDPLLSLMQAFTWPASEYLRIGAEALSQGEPEKAANALTLAVNIDPDSSQVRLALAQALAAQGSLGESLQQLERAVELDPKNADAHFYLGALYEAGGQDDRAIASYAAAEANRSGYRAARLGLANALMREQRYVESAELYAALATSNEKDRDLRFWEGMAWLAAGRCNSAEQALLAAFEFSPGAGHVIHALSRLYATCPETEDIKKKNALAYAQMMYERDPGLDTAETLAMALAANGMYGDAEEFQAQALFEAAKLQDQETAGLLRENLQRYQQQSPAEFAWPPGHPIYAPPRMSLGDAP